MALVVRWLLASLCVVATSVAAARGIEGASAPNVAPLDPQEAVGTTSCGPDSPRVAYRGTTDEMLVRKICNYAKTMAESCETGQCLVAGMLDVVEGDPSLLVLLHRRQVYFIQFIPRRDDTAFVYVGFGSVGSAGLLLRLTYANLIFSDADWEVSLPNQ